MAFKIIRNDITRVCADAIVNTANPQPTYAGGTDAAIYKAAGEQKLLEERKKIGVIEIGQAAETPAFYLNARYIIHTVGPIWIDGKHGEYESVRKCYMNSLKLAKKLRCESIAFPLIATGVYGFPKAEALRIAISVFSEFLVDEEMQISLVVFDSESFVLSGKLFSEIDSYIDENYVSVQADAEYSVDRAMYSVGYPVENQYYYDDEETDEILNEDSFPLLSMSSMMPVMEASIDNPTGSLEDIMAHVADTWQESLFRLIDEKGFNEVEVYKRANVDRKLFSKIRSNAFYQPKKITAVAFALALQLNIDQTKDMLARAGYALSPSSKFDLIVRYFIENEVYDTYTINLALFEHDQPLLGA